MPASIVLLSDGLQRPAQRGDLGEEADNGGSRVVECFCIPAIIGIDRVSLQPTDH